MVNGQRTDFLVGLFLIIAVGVVAGMAIVTSGLGVERIDVYMRATSAEALSQDTRVVLRGLTVGRVREISPVVDSVSGALSFIARLSLQERFPNGTKLVLPRGTRAVISQPTPIAAAQIDLILPAQPTPGVTLEAGDTVNSERPRNIMDALGEMASELRDELRESLRDTRTLLERSTGTIDQAQRLMAANAPVLTEVLTRLSANLERSEALLADLGPRVGPMHDSLIAVLTDTRRALARADTLLALAADVTGENRTAVRDLTHRLLRTATVLEHFTNQISRRPLRLLTGVRPLPDSAPLPPDSTRGRQ